VNYVINDDVTFDCKGNLVVEASHTRCMLINTTNNIVSNFYEYK
jgi:hypothetical protein